MSSNAHRQIPGDKRTSSSSESVMLLHNLCSSCSDPFLFSFTRTRELKREFFIETPPYAQPKTRDRQGKRRADPSTNNTRSLPISASYRTDRRFLAEPPDSPDSNSSHRRWLSGATTVATTRPGSPEADSSTQPSRSDMAAASVADPSPLTAFFGFSTKSQHYLFSEDEAANNRKALFPQSRELYLHPAQLYSPPSIKEAATIAGAGGAGNEAQSLEIEPPSPAISLPPMFTVDEIEAALFKQFPPPPPPSREGPPAFFPEDVGGSGDIPVPYYGVRESRVPAYSPADAPSSSSAPGQPHWHPLGPTADQVQQAQQAPHYSSHFPPTPYRGPFIPPPNVLTASQAVHAQERTDAPSVLVGGTEFDAARPASSDSAHSGQFGGYQYEQQPGYYRSPVVGAPEAHRYGSPPQQAARASSGSGGVKSEDDDGSYTGGKGTSTSARKGKGKEGAGKRTGKLPNSTTALLRDWLMLHVQHPYPTEDEKKELCATTGLTMNQVSNWFINARRRILPSLSTVTVSGGRKQFTPIAGPYPQQQRLNAVGARLPPHRSAAGHARSSAAPYPMPVSGAPPYPYAFPGYPGYPPPPPPPMGHPAYPPVHPHAHAHHAPAVLPGMVNTGRRDNAHLSARDERPLQRADSRPNTGSSRHSG